MKILAIVTSMFLAFATVVRRTGNVSGLVALSILALSLVSHVQAELLFDNGSNAGGNVGDIQLVGFKTKEQACYLTDVEVAMATWNAGNGTSDYEFGLFKDAGPNTDPRSGVLVCSFNEPPISSSLTGNYFSLNPTSAAILEPDTLYWLVLEQGIHYGYNLAQGRGYNFLSEDPNIFERKLYLRTNLNDEWQDYENYAVMPSIRLFGSSVPEPTTLILLAIGSLMLLVTRRW